MERKEQDQNIYEKTPKKRKAITKVGSKCINLDQRTIYDNRKKPWKQRPGLLGLWALEPL